MNKIIKELLKGQSGDYIFPFFWQHGEDEKTLRTMMKVIHETGCKSVCIESRPHPDFCGPKWWTDMDIILDEARNRKMKVWILDDSHFPTGFANGKVVNAPLELHRQSLVQSHKDFHGSAKDITLNINKLFPPKLKAPSLVAAGAMKYMNDNCHFDDDRIVAIYAVNHQGERIDIDINNPIFHKPKGNYRVYVIGLSRNYGIHKQYMNMMDSDSVKILIDEVYEKHYDHYKEDFGKTIEGFFSDEPELGNGFYATALNLLGSGIDLPYSRELEEELKTRLGKDFARVLYLLWDNDGDKNKTAKIRYEYMDAVTKLVRKDFSIQVADWCHQHNVKYIGHVIEDNNQHSQTAASLGHYFRGLNGQDMSGIDDIGGQVLPQGEDIKMNTFSGPRDGEFFHFMLGNLAASAAAIEPNKNGNSMCEIFGNYGWQEGARLEKHLADHFMVRGINHYVPHAFTGKAFPDPDCPPHFYADGNNPQYRHFGQIVEYMNRVCALISNGHRDSKVAVLYNAEAEWMGKCMLSQKPVRKLYENQILPDCIPIDAFTEVERYHTEFKDVLKVNRQEYQVLVIPTCEFITKEFNDALAKLNIPILFIDKLPKVIDEDIELNYRTISLDQLVDEVKQYVEPCLDINPKSKDIRILEYTNSNTIYYLFNESAKTYKGKLNLNEADYYEYDAWANKCYAFNNEIEIEPNKSLIIIKDHADDKAFEKKLNTEGNKQRLTSFSLSKCKALDYPNFDNPIVVNLPYDFTKANKKFSGFIRYETTLTVDEINETTLEITDAYEGVEVFVNGHSLGIQVVPTYLYNLTDYLAKGENKLVIEVATTLERQVKSGQKLDLARLVLGQGGMPKDPLGITGEVNIYTK